jgi:hypothetical protein
LATELRFHREGEQDKALRGKGMFRAEIRSLANGPTLKLQGRLVGAWAEEARSLVTNDVVPKGLIVDLSDMTYLDATGEDLLNWLGSIGAKFMPTNVYAAGVCERLSLPVVGRLSHTHKAKLADTNEKAAPAMPCE